MSAKRSLTPSQLMAAALMLGGVAWLLARWYFYRGWVDDDAYISFRYARNLAEGNGLVFNLGERVEGYTNFLWTICLAAAYKLGADLPSAARMLGGACALATVGVLWAFSRTRLLRVPESIPSAARPFVALVAPLCLCLSDTWAAWAAGGLENCGSALLVSIGLLAYVRALEDQSQQPRMLGLCALALSLAVLNHPSNAVFAALVFFHAATRVGSGISMATLRAPLLIFALIVGSWVAWRLVYYGDWLPNTYHAKVGWSRFVLLRGLRYFGEVAGAMPLGYAAAVACCALALRRHALRPAAALFASGALLYSAYVLAVGGEQFPGFRALIVVLPLLAITLQVLAHELCELLVRRVHGAGVAGVVAAVLALSVVAAHAVPLYASPRIRILDEALFLGRTALSTTAARRLKELLPPDTLFAHSGAGLIAYHTNFPWIDTLGLTDRHIARTQVVDIGKGAAGHEKGDGAYVWSRQPDYVMFPGYPISNRMPGTKGGRELIAIPEFRNAYRSVRLPFSFQGPHDVAPQEHELFLWQRTGAPGPASP